MALTQGDALAITRRAALGALGAGVVGATVASWPRLTGTDIPGRGDNSLSIVIQGTKADASARQKLVADFNKVHPDIRIKVQAIQSVDWKDFFVKLLTMVAAGQSPDLVYVATEGTQLFAERLAEPLDSYVQRDAAELKEYFEDVHPSLVEAMMYKGSLYQLPMDWNAANMYFNTSALAKAGLQMPADDWTHLDFRTMLSSLKQANGSDFTPYYWTNRLFGGVVPWLYINDTSVLKETKAPGGRWLWDSFYQNDPSSKMRTGGALWEAPNALDPRVEESFDFLRGLVKDGLGVRPEEGGGNTLVGLFASGRIGTTPAGGYWVEGLHEAGMTQDQYDVAFFPKWRTQRHQFGTAGYAIMKTAKDKDAAWEFVKWAASKPAMETQFALPTTTPTRRSMVNEALYAGKGPKHWKVFYDTLDKFPSTGPIPAPPQQAAVETALIKNVSLAVSGDQAQLKSALQSLQRDLEQALGGK
ncbi:MULTISPECIES: extracellular solute-binding protein [Arthrobacter]|uniref:Extracellular solute-binding protein n=2 Tax=Arthrobacter TaxID=1663 RepID=A0ABU9KKZ8_9MICC|nr:extracellular solute-binding protein [Arthrobacter sp. YJM1]MDP5227513.1 extracellular solute-binding protein [Arthrobacter sp. YJM1]